MKDNIVARFVAKKTERPSSIAYLVRDGDAWQPTSWRRYVEQVSEVGRALIAMGIVPGDRIAILGNNRPEWSIMAMAAMAVRATPAGIYTTCSPSEVHYILDHSEAKIVLVEDEAQLAKVNEVRSKLPALTHVVLMNQKQRLAGSVAWAELGEWTQKVASEQFDLRVDSIEQSDLATLIYTSGTTGPPKAVMITHGNLTWTSLALAQVGGWVEGDVLVSYLPLSHIAEQMATIHMPATVGATIYYAPSLEALPQTIATARPTVFFGVPRVWEKFHASLAQKLGEVTGPKAKLVGWARSVATRVNDLRDRDSKLPRVLELQFKLAERLVFSKLKAKLGFDRLRIAISGAAPISRDVLEFFSSLDLPIREIYGQSEDTGPTASNMPGRTRLGTVGVPIPGLTVKIADDGEILVKGPNVFAGYLKDPQATAEVLVDGWLHSGDLGSFDREGYLSITGRKKEIIITAGGKNITPKNIEAEIKKCPHVADVVVIGDRQKFLTVLVTLQPTLAGRESDPKLLGDIQAAIDLANQQLARVEQVKKFTVLANAFSVASGEYTPTMKLRRSVIAKMYAEQIAAMYRE